MKKILIFILLLMLATDVFAVTFKIGVVVPEGTSWAKSLKKMVKEIKQKTDGRVSFKVYFGGTQGDEADVLRKIRVGHLQGGIFTGKTLGEINGNVRVMEVPFTFMDDREKAWKTLQQMEGYFNNGFLGQGFVNLGLFETGLIYLISNKEIKDLSALEGVKVWSWAGDEVALSFIKYLKMIPIPLALTDVLSSLSTGVIDATYGPGTGILAMQWHTKTKYIVDFPVTYSMGAFLIDKRIWNKVHPQDMKIIQEISSKQLALINQANVDDNKSSFEALKGLGIKFVTFPKEDLKKVPKIRQDIIKILEGKVFSAEARKKMESLL